MGVDNKIKVLDKGFVKLEGVLGTDRNIANSARISYLAPLSDDENDYNHDHDKKLIRRLIFSKHTSPFEQAELRFLVKAPIFVARQWMRHRTWSYIEVSRRFTSKDIDFYTPDFRTAVEKDAYTEAINAALLSYRKLLDFEVKKEAARCVLPVSLYTIFYAKADLHNLLRFLELRRANDAQYEIREYAKAIEKIVKEKFPITYAIWTEFLTKQ